MTGKTPLAATLIVIIDLEIKDEVRTIIKAQLLQSLTSQDPERGKLASSTQSDDRFPHTPQKRLQSVPSSAPRDTVTRGKYTFIKGVRLRDYEFPRQGGNEAVDSAAFQCRDGFSREETSRGYLRTMAKLTASKE